MSHGSRMLDQSLSITQGNCDGSKLHAVQSSADLLSGSLQLYGHHAAVHSHLLLSDLVTLEALKTRIVNLLDCRMRLKESGKLHSVLAVTLYTDVKGLKASCDQECVERAHNAAGHILDTEHLNSVDELSVGHNEAGNDIAVAVDVLGSGMNYYVSAKGQRVGDVG